MAHVVKKLARGTTAECNAYAGPQGELVMDTQTNELVLQTGAKGGVRIGNKLGIATVGGKTQPIYLNKGLPAICDTVANMVASAITEAIAGTAADDKALKEALTKVVTKVFTDSATGTDATSKALQSSVEKIVAAAVKAAVDGTATNDKALHDAISNMVADIFKEAAADPDEAISKTLNGAISSTLTTVFKEASDPKTTDEQAKALRKATTSMIAAVLDGVINGGAEATAEDLALQKNLVDLIVKSAQESETLSSALKTVLGIPIMLTADKVMYVDGTDGIDSPTYEQAITAKRMTSADVPKSVTKPASTKVPETTLVGINWGSTTKSAFKTITAACAFAAKWYNLGAHNLTIRVAGGQYGATTIAAPAHTTGDFTIEPISTKEETASTLDSSNNVITRLENKIYDGTTCTITRYENVRIVSAHSTTTRAIGFTNSNVETYFRHIAIIVVYLAPTSRGNKYPYCVGIAKGADVTFITCEFWYLSALILRSTAPGAITSTADTESWIDTRGISVYGNAVFQSSCSFISAYIDLFGLESMTDNYYTTTSGAAARKFFRGEFATKAAFDGALPPDPAHGDIVKVVNDESVGGGINYYYYNSKNKWTSGAGQPSHRVHAAYRIETGGYVAFSDSNTQNAPNYYFYGGIWGDLIWVQDGRIKFEGGLNYSPRIVSACPTALIKSTKTTDGTAPTNPAGNVLYVQNGDKYTTYTFVDWYTRDSRATEGGYEYRPLTPLTLTDLTARRFDRKLTVQAANAIETFDINVDAAGTITVTNKTQNKTFTTYVGRCRVDTSIDAADGANFRAVHLPMPNDPKLKKIELAADSNSTFQGSRPTEYKDYEEVKYGVTTEKRSSATFNDTSVDSVRLS